MVDWEPISLDALLARIGQGHARITQAQQRLWDAIRINPEKWQQHPFGDAGGGFWTVWLVGRTVIWYNDLEVLSIRSTRTPAGGASPPPAVAG
jgi:hypothetical protein